MFEMLRWRHRANKERGAARLASCHLALLTTLISSIAAANDSAVAQTAPSPLVARLSAVFADLPGNAHVGFSVVDVRDGSKLFARDETAPLKPASVLKLFTTAAALERFGQNFRFETRVYLRDGELWVVGAGDPALGDERIAQKQGKSPQWALEDWSQKVAERGVRELRTVVLSDDIFDQQGRHTDWPAAQAEAWYQAPVSGLNFNDNCVDAMARVANGRVDLRLTPNLPDSFVRNGLTIGKKHAPSVTRELDSDIFEFRGSLARSDSFAPISVHRPTVILGYALSEALAARGVRSAGGVVRRASPSAPLYAGDLIATHVTPIRDVVWRCNTFSQNLFAECLLKSLAAYEPDGRRSGTPGSWEAGVAVLTRTLNSIGVDTTGAVFRDGSGLSHENRVTAAQISQLLAVMARHPCHEIYEDSLADAGEDGTLRRRFASFKGRLRAKTGTIAGVSTLAGYVTREDGNVVAFALLTNGSTPPKLQERVVEALAKP